MADIQAHLRRGLALHQQGRLADAEKIYREVIRRAPNHFDALHLLGVLAQQTGAHERAVQLISKAIALNPNLASAYYNKGNALKDLKRFEEAIGSYDKAIALQPDFESYAGRGIALTELNRFDDALVSYDKAIALKSESAEAHYNRGNALRALRRLEEARASYDKAIALKADFAEAYANRANTLEELMRFEDALASYDSVVALKPDFEAHYNRGIVLQQLKRIDDAILAYDKAIALKPDFAEAHVSRGVALHDVRRFHDALASFDRAIALKPDFADAYFNRGNALRELDRPDDALASYDTAIALKPDFAGAYNNMGNVQKELGRMHEAHAAFLKAITIDPTGAGAFFNLTEIKTFAPGDEHLVAMQRLAAEPERLSATARVELDFALAKAYADAKDHPRSFQHLSTANAAKRAMLTYEETAAFALFDRIEATFTPPMIAARSGGGHPSQRPIFVIGMPRSGTTLVEQILASHPRVAGAGELETFKDVITALRARIGTPYPEFVPALDGSALAELGALYLAAVRSRWAHGEHMTDKMPSNYYFVGLIHLALPNATIIHTLRNPVDTCVSCFSKLFTKDVNYTYDLGELGRYYKRYERLMAHWRRVLPAGRILDVAYEDVVADVETQARRILSHCGLPWDDRCLSFHRTARPVRTASATQVRQPIYQKAVGRWHDYEEFLAPLLSALDFVPSTTKLRSD